MGEAPASIIITAACQAAYAGRRCSFASSDEFVEFLSITEDIYNYSGKLLEMEDYFLLLDEERHAIVRFQGKGTLTPFQSYFGKEDTSGDVNDRGIYARFNTPRDFIRDPSTGNIYVVDAGSQKLKRINTNQGDIVTVVEGLTDPRGISMDVNGIMYITDGHSIKMITKLPTSSYKDDDVDSDHYTTSTLCGDVATNGHVDSVTGLLARFNTPHDILYSESYSALFVADKSNQVIRKVFLSGEVQTLGTYNGGTPGFRDGLISEALFNEPTYLSLYRDALYVSDVGNMIIRRISLRNDAVTTVSGVTGEAATTSLTSDSLNSNMRFEKPGPVLVSRIGELFVAEMGSISKRKIIHVHAPSKIHPQHTTVVEGKCFGTNHSAIVLNEMFEDDPEGWTIHGAELSEKCGSLSGKSLTFTGDNVRRREAITPSISMPAGISTMHVKVSHFISFNITGSSTCGGFQRNDTSLFSSITVGIMYPRTSQYEMIETLQPQTLSDAHNTDADGRHSFEFTVSDTFALYWTQNFATASIDTFYAGKEEWSLDALLVEATPQSTDVCSGHGSCANTDSCICEVHYNGDQCQRSSICDNTQVKLHAGTFDSSGSADQTFAAKFYSPSGMTSDKNNDLFVVDRWNHAIRLVSSNGFTRSVAGVLGQSGYEDGTSSDRTLFNQPFDITIDSNSRDLFVTDTMNHAVRRIRESFQVETVSKNTTYLSHPMGIAYHGNRIYVSNSGMFHNIVIFNSTLIDGEGEILTGSSTVGHRDGNCSVALFQNPIGLAVSDDGDFLFVADRGSASIRRIDMSNGGCFVSTITSLGENVYSGFREGHSVQSQFALPTMLDYSHNSLYISDQNGQVVRRLNLANGITTTLAGYKHTKASSDDSFVPKTSIPVSAQQATFGKIGGIHIRGSHMFISDIETNVIHRLTYSMHPSCSCLDWDFGESTCSCHANRRGDKCEYIRYWCFGVASTDSFVCTNQTGICSTTDTCVCPTGTTGAQCELNDCADMVQNQVEVAAVVPPTTALSQQIRGFFVDASYLYISESNTKNKILTLTRDTLTLQDYAGTGAASSASGGKLSGGSFLNPASIVRHAASQKTFLIDDSGLRSVDENTQQISGTLFPGIDSEKGIGVNSDGSKVFVLLSGVPFYFRTADNFQSAVGLPLLCESMAFDSEANILYVAPDSGLTLVTYDDNTLAQSTVAGSTLSSQIKDGIADSARFEKISAISIDYSSPIHQRVVYVLDQNTVRKVDTWIQRVTTIATLPTDVYQRALFVKPNPAPGAFKETVLYYARGSTMNTLLISMSSTCHCSEWDLNSKCECQDGWKDSSCRTPMFKCFGIFEDRADVCSGHGACVGPNVCQCTAGRTDYNCHIPTCNGVAATETLVCQSHGTCVDENVCECALGYQLGEPNSCNPCETGQYQTNNGSQILCNKCPLGTSSETVASHSLSNCTSCPRNHYADTPGLFECIACPVGTHHVNETTTGEVDSSNCVTCAVGSFAETGKECKPCPKGTWTNVSPATSVLQCMKCNPGYWSDIEGASNNTTCLACPHGTWSDRYGLTSEALCIPCVAGTWSSGGPAETSDSVCSACPAGTASSIEGATSSSVCQICPAGYYAPTGSAQCLICPKGSFSLNPGSWNCTSCPVGTTTPSDGTTSADVCTSCPAGTFTSPGGLGCVNCPSGSYSSTTSASSILDCQACPDGEYAPMSGMASCLPCQAGRYAPNARSCVPCDGGTFTSESNSVICNVCPKGTYSLVESRSCIECAAGFYNNNSRSASPNDCIRCPSGHISAQGATSCDACQPGTYANIQQTSCVSCLPGKFSTTIAASNSTSCLDCPKGTYSATVGANSSSQCILCEAGSYSDFEGQTLSTTCVSCPSGTYQGDLGAQSVSDCKLCNSGTYAPEERSSSCAACESSEVCPFVGQSVVLNPNKKGVVPLQEESHKIVNPQSLSPPVSLASYLTKFTPILILLLVGSVLFSCLIALSCCMYGKNQMCLILEKADLFFTMRHRLNNNEPRTKKKTRLGGCLSLIALVIVLILLCMSTSDLFFNNIYVQESFTTPKGQIFDKRGDFEASVFFFGSYSNCSSIEVRARGFLKSENSDIQPKETTVCQRETTYEGFNVDSCHCRWNCPDCGLDGVEQEIVYTAPTVVATSLGYEFKVPHYLSQMQFSLQGELVNDKNTAFYGSDASVLFINVFNTIYSRQPNLYAPIVNLFSFLAPALPVDQGLQSQLQSASYGSIVDNLMLPKAHSSDEFQGVKVQMAIQVSNFIFVLEEQLRQSTLNYFAQVSALSSLVIAVCAIILSVLENCHACGMGTKRRLAKQKEKKENKKKIERKKKAHPTWIDHDKYDFSESSIHSHENSSSDLLKSSTTSVIGDTSGGSVFGGFSPPPPIARISASFGPGAKRNSFATPGSPVPFVMNMPKLDDDDASFSGSSDESDDDNVGGGPNLGAPPFMRPGV
eukprot:CAMPEP_0117442160 /NCGR_PEP_ID=MMETSP0759-20121206/4007_1 /TAXON_ID=63605 /ORGANISM="Percolomonas cosmopolitus, Strain WS" /LENGTH=2451 /DNA_ID=CAMNT_0005234037 /DNA_START=450 /DNA_END=7804 /DNA_ORIENTATION=-